MVILGQVVAATARTSLAPFLAMPCACSAGQSSRRSAACPKSESTHALLGRSADHEARDVDEEDERNAALLAQLDELRRLERRRRQEDTVVGNLRARTKASATLHARVIERERERADAKRRRDYGDAVRVLSFALWNTPLQLPARVLTRRVQAATEAEPEEEHNTEDEMPKYYRKVEIKYSRFGIEDFDFECANSPRCAPFEMDSD